MPTYDYQCDACDHSMELFQGINDPVVKKCPECGKNKLQRLFGSGAAIVFKGSGFYQTDYRSENYRKAAKADQKSATESKGGESKDKSKSSSPKAADTKSASSAKAKSDS